MLVRRVGLGRSPQLGHDVRAARERLELLLRLVAGLLQIGARGAAVPARRTQQACEERLADALGQLRHRQRDLERLLDEEVAERPAGAAAPMTGQKSL